MNESEIFNAAAKLPAAKRPAFLDQACGDDRALAANLASLLAAHEEVGDFLEPPPPPTQVFSPIAEGPGTVIGPYKLLQQIGEGGFGVVYMAEQQQPVRRKVALKIIKPGMDTREVVARFESERQALALMDHPNIARVFDAGATASGRPYFVMELVKGIPITDYCDKNNLSTEQRLELFVTVCHAVQHAHQKGVIHRDIKPTNVLVTLHDGKPVPKVIDFGVSKATSQQLTEKTLFTAFGQMIGTPAYMSPEQAEMSGLDIDTRSDIYSLGVLLYELLTGTTPFESRRLRAAGYAEMQRIIREENPPRPSMRISTLGDSLTAVSSHRSIDPKRLSQLLRGDLDVIVMKALEKERGLRYGTPNAFAEDVERYLRREAILARPASATYRIRKFAQRNKVGVATVASVATLLIAGTLVSTWLAVREHRASEKARVAQTDAEQNLLEVERQRNVAETAVKQEAEQRRLAVAREAEAKRARQSEAMERAAAEAERDKVKQLNDEVNERKEQQRRMLYAAQMNLVQAAWEAGNVERMNALLFAARPQPGEIDLRGFEWHYWRRMCHQETSTIRLGVRIQSRPVGGSAIFSADGRHVAAIVSSESGEELKVWKTGDVEPIFSQSLDVRFAALRQSSTTSESRTSFFFSPAYVDANRVAVCAVAQSADIRHVVAEIQAMSNDDELTDDKIADLIEARGSGVAQLCAYDLASGQEVYFLTTRLTYSGESPFAFNQDGSRIVSRITHRTPADRSGVENVAYVWDGRTGARLEDVDLPNSLQSGIALNSDGSKLATAVSLPGRGLSSSKPSSQIAVVDLMTGQATQFGDGLVVARPEFTPNGKQIIAQCLSETREVYAFKVFDVANGKELRSIPAISLAAANVAFSPTGNWLISAGRNTSEANAALALWDMETGREGPKLLGHRAPIEAIGVSKDGASIYSVDQQGLLKTWPLPKPTVVSQVHPFRAILTLLAGSPDGRWSAFPPGGTSATGFTAFASSTRSIRPSEIEIQDHTGQVENRTYSLAGPAWFIAFSRDSKLLAAAFVAPKAEPSQAGEIKVWDLVTGELRFSRRFPAFRDPAARTLSQSSRARGPIYPNVSRIAFSPNGRQIALCADMQDANKESSLLRVWDLMEDRDVLTIALDEPQLTSVKFNPQGDTLAICGPGDDPVESMRHRAIVRDGLAAPAFANRLEIRDARTGQLRWRDDRSTALVAFSEDGNLVATLAEEDGATEAPRRFYTVRRASTGETHVNIPSPLGPTTVWLSLSHDGSRLAAIRQWPATSSASQSGDVAVFDTRDARELYSLRGLRGQISGVAFSPDGKRIATSGAIGPGVLALADLGETNVWDATDGQLLLALSGSPRWLKFTQHELRADYSECGGASSDARPGRRWNAAPLPSRFEAVEYIERLAATIEKVAIPTPSGNHQWIPVPLTRDEIAARLQNDLQISGDVRAEAIALAKQLRRDESTLRTACFALSRLAGLPRSLYERALAYGVEACEAAPDNPFSWSYRGVAHYRLGEYRQTVEHCERSLKLRSDARRDESAKDLFFLAMARFQLGDRPAAIEALRQGQHRVLGDDTPVSRDRKQFLAEAETMIGAATGGSVSELWAGQSFMLRIDAPQLNAEGDVNSLARLVSPFVVERVAGDTLVTGDLQILKSNVVPLEVADSYFTSTLGNTGQANRTMLARYSRGVARTREKRYAEAANDLSRAARSDEGRLLTAMIAAAPTMATYRAARGAFLAEENSEAAVAELNEAIHLQPDVAAFYPIRAYVRLKRGDSEGSLADANQAVALLPNDPGPLISRGAIYMRMAKHDEALADFEELIELDPNRSASYEMRGAARRALGDLDGALADFSEAIRRDKNRAPSYELRGLTHSAKREYRRAMDDHRAAIRLSPKTARFHFNLGAAATAAGSSSDLAAYTTAVELSPTNPRYLEGRARALYYRREYDAALDDLSKALASDEKYVRAYITRSEVLRKRNDLDGAIRDLDRAIEIDAKFAYAHAVRGSIWREKGDFAKALADYDKSIDLDPKGSRALIAAGLGFEQPVLTPSFATAALAVADATKACELENWRNLDYISALAAAHAEAGEFDKAIERQQQALAKIGTTEKAEYERRLALFRERKPLRDTPGPETDNGEMPGPAVPTPIDNAAH